MSPSAERLLLKGKLACSLKFQQKFYIWFEKLLSSKLVLLEKMFCDFCNKERPELTPPVKTKKRDKFQGHLFEVLQYKISNKNTIH